MKVVIYYFTGTGNSLCVASDIAESLKADLVPIASLVNENEVRVEADAVGIVFPVYYGDLPLIVRRFAVKLDNLQNKYIFSVCTFGGAAGNSFITLRNIIESREGNLAATYGVHMPQNAFYKFWEKHEPLYRNWRKKVKFVAKNTTEGRTGKFFRNDLFDLIFKGIYRYVRLRYRKTFAEISTGYPEISEDEKIYHLNEAGFSSTDDCTGCGICSMVCPVSNIEMVGNRPVWGHKCEHCIACYNWCPSKAVRSSLISGSYYYRHPDITAKDIIGQKQKEK